MCVNNKPTSHTCIWEVWIVIGHPELDRPVCDRETKRKEKRKKMDKTQQNSISQLQLHVHKNYRKLHVNTGSHLGLHLPTLLPVPLSSCYLDNSGSECSSVMTSVLHTFLQLLQRWASIRMKWEWTSWAEGGSWEGTARTRERDIQTGGTKLGLCGKEQHLHTSQIQHLIHTAEYVSSLGFRMALNLCPQVIWDNYRQYLVITFTQ